MSVSLITQLSTVLTFIATEGKLLESLQGIRIVTCHISA